MHVCVDMDEVEGYKEQLNQVEEALKINPDDTDLLGIKSELTELISISNELYINEPENDNTNNNNNNHNHYQKNERNSVDKKGKGKVMIDTLDIWEEIVVEDQIPTYISISDNEDDNERQRDDGDVVVLGAIAKPVSFVLSKKKVDFTLKLQEESESEGEDDEKEKNNRSSWFKNNMHISRSSSTNSNNNSSNKNNNSSSGSYNSLTEWDKSSNGKFSKMMEKMGYKRGTGLGKHGTGIVEALDPQRVTSQTLGLGYQKRPHSHIQNNNNNNNNTNGSTQGSAFLASKRMKSSDVFSFLNKSIGGETTAPRNTQSTSIHNSSEEDLKAEVTRRQNDREKLLIKMQNLNQSLSRFTVRKENDDIVQSLKSTMEKVAKELEESNVKAEMAENRLKMKREKQKLMKF